MRLAKQSRSTGGLIGQRGQEGLGAGATVGKDSAHFGTAAGAAASTIGLFGGEGEPLDASFGIIGVGGGAAAVTGKGGRGAGDAVGSVGRKLRGTDCARRGSTAARSQ